MPRTETKPPAENMVAAWEECSKYQRIIDCIVMLSVHGYVGDAEKQRMLKKLGGPELGKRVTE